MCFLLRLALILSQLLRCGAVCEHNSRKPCISNSIDQNVNRENVVYVVRLSIGCYHQVELVGSCRNWRLLRSCGDDRINLPGFFCFPMVLILTCVDLQRE